MTSRLASPIIGKWPHSFAYLSGIPSLWRGPPVPGLPHDTSLLSLDYKALQAAEILNSDGGASICLKQSCPQPWRIGQREHSLSRRHGSLRIACMPMDRAAT